jgi:single-stranded DNA-specific DHH superfamily exonuclease
MNGMKKELALIKEIEEKTKILNTKVKKQEEININNWISQQLKIYVMNHPETTRKEIGVVLSRMLNNLEKNQDVYKSSMCINLNNYAKNLLMLIIEKQEAQKLQQTAEQIRLY